MRLKSSCESSMSTSGAVCAGPLVCGCLIIVESGVLQGWVPGEVDGPEGPAPEPLRKLRILPLPSSSKKLNSSDAQPATYKNDDNP